ncbi:hypothetical protein ACL58G_06020 [Massilia sp. GER05]|uniref:hypothetical protein n=1 Tax=Massilia sp. GER05 TaxID=3394605 RepID=UPI003F85CA94
MTATKEKRRASDVLYEEILDSRNSGRRENIRIIKEVCDQMERDRVIITAAEVVRRGGEHGPAYSTISNKGSQLGEYVKLRITEQAAALPQSPGREQDLAERISDPVLAAQIRDKESTARWLQKENTALRHLLKNLSPGADIDTALSRATKGQPLIAARPPSAAPASDELSGALLKLMDHLIHERQYVEMRGRLTINHKAILDPRELSTLRQACGLREDEWKLRYGSA